jgi:outer membrane protein OmpU
MKNVLFTTTALVAFSATAAFADLTVSGMGELGLTSNDANVGEDLSLHTDFDIVWSFTGATDGGLSFGATGDWDEANVEESAAVFVSGAFGTVTGGDTDGAFDAAMYDIQNGGLAGEADHFSGNSDLDNVADIAAAGTASQLVRYDIAFGSTTVSASWENGNTAAATTKQTLGLGAKFSFGSIALGTGFQQNDGDTISGLSVQAGVGPATVTVSYATVTDDAAGVAYAAGDKTTTGISATFGAGAATIGVAYEDVNNSGAVADTDAWGAWVDYSLGGGATAKVAAGETHAGASKFGGGIGLSF